MFNGISILIVKPEEMRYSTVGDWQLHYNPNNHDEKLEITIADTGNTSYNMLVATHELVEALLCWFDHITPEHVDKWDSEHPDDDEPGEVIGCPYYWQHAVANICERIVAQAMSVSWELYEAAIEKTAEKVETYVRPLKVRT